MNVVNLKPFVTRGTAGNAVASGLGGMSRYERDRGLLASLISSSRAPDDFLSFPPSRSPVTRHQLPSNTQHSCILRVYPDTVFRTFSSPTRYVFFFLRARPFFLLSQRIARQTVRVTNYDAPRHLALDPTLCALVPFATKGRNESGKRDLPASRQSRCLNHVPSSSYSSPRLSVNTLLLRSRERNRRHTKKGLERLEGRAGLYARQRPRGAYGVSLPSPSSPSLCCLGATHYNRGSTVAAETYSRYLPGNGPFLNLTTHSPPRYRTRCIHRHGMMYRS